MIANDSAWSSEVSAKLSRCSSTLQSLIGPVCVCLSVCLSLCFCASSPFHSPLFSYSSPLLYTLLCCPLLYTLTPRFTLLTSHLTSTIGYYTLQSLTNYNNFKSLLFVFPNLSSNLISPLLFIHSFIHSFWPFL